jgi:hypothetical protein
MVCQHCDNSPCDCAHFPQADEDEVNVHAFKKGDVVFANRVLLDKEHDGDWRITAIHGDLGVVNDYGQSSPSVDVSWYNGNQCTVHEDWIDLYQGGVEKVVD